LSFVTPPCQSSPDSKEKGGLETVSKEQGGLETDSKEKGRLETVSKEQGGLETVSKEQGRLETVLGEKRIKKEKPDAIYLGLSYWGNMKMGRKKLLAECMEKDEKVVLINDKVFMKKGARGEDWDEHFFRIRDMFGAHAILYISKTYMVETLKICIMAVSMNKPHDIYLPKLQKKYLVLGQKKPWFYQLARLGGQEMGTNINFSGVRKITSENI
jgi:hypothetical protein